jgi:hypothetical protein
MMTCWLVCWLLFRNSVTLLLYVSFFEIKYYLCLHFIMLPMFVFFYCIIIVCLLFIIWKVLSSHIFTITINAFTLIIMFWDCVFRNRLVLIYTCIYCRSLVVFFWNTALLPSSSMSFYIFSLTAFGYLRFFSADSHHQCTIYPIEIVYKSNTKHLLFNQ